MDKIINVSVQNKVAMADGTMYICGNSDYYVEFDFDRDWDGARYKTARFQYGKDHLDVLFEGNICPVPILNNVNNFKIGVFSGDLQTSTPAMVYAKKSILCADGSPAAPSDDIYNQIIDALNSKGEVSEEDIEKAVEEYMADNPVGVISNTEIDTILSGG